MGVQNYSNVDPVEEENVNKSWIDGIYLMSLHNHNEYGEVCDYVS